MTLKSTGFKFLAKIMGRNYTFCCSNHNTLNPTSHLDVDTKIISKSLAAKLKKTLPKISSSNETAYINHINDINDILGKVDG